MVEHQNNDMGEKQIFTIGHSNRSLDEFVKVLKHHNIEVLVDVRHFPRSGHNPQFNKEILDIKLPESGMQYIWIERNGECFIFMMKRSLRLTGHLDIHSDTLRRTKMSGVEMKRTLIRTVLLF